MLVVCEPRPWVTIHRYRLIGCPYGTVLVYHLIRPNIRNVLHGVPNDRDLRVGITVWLIVCHVVLCTLLDPVQVGSLN